MDAAEIEAVLTSAERELAAGRAPDLKAIGFWRAVSRVKRSASLSSTYAARIARVDRETFLRRVPLHAGAAVGLVVLGLAMAAGLLIIGAARSFDHPLRELAVLVGAGALIGATHDLTHFVVGSLLNIRFTHFFVAPPMPQPGLKLEYGSYLRATPARRAWMHASGAIVSKIVPFAVVPYALAIGCDDWATWVLVAIGAGSVVTDVLFSTRASDWKRFRREMRAARPSRASRTTPSAS